MTHRRLTLEKPPFAGRSGRGVVVAVLDSGIIASHPHIGGTVAAGYNLSGDGDASDVRDRLGHGTAVAAAIREKAPDSIILPVRVFARSLTIGATQLAAAICRAADAGAALINVSMGTPNEDRRELLRDAVDHALALGALVVAAASSEGVAMFPGCLPGAVGVELDAACARDGLILLAASGESWRFAAAGLPRPIPGVPPERNLRGASFAVANVTGFLARLLEGEPRTGARAALEALRTAAVSA